MLLLRRTALVALLWRFLMTRIRLALMLYFLMVAHKVACQTLSKAFLESKVQVLLVLEIFLTEDTVVLLPALKPAWSSAMVFFACGFSLFSIIFNMTLLGWLMRLIVR